MFGTLKRVRRLYQWLSNLEHRSGLQALPTVSDYKNPKVLTGTLLSHMNLERVPHELRDIEFQVFSQFGDDGIIQYLVHSLPIRERTFVEFGVENYTEANTRFLLVKDKWSGLVLDGSQSNIAYIRNDSISRLFDLRAKQAFITAENINRLLADESFDGTVGLLSIDIDGMDYWVWDALDAVKPAIVVIEYNALFGPERSIVVPYDPDFAREKAHPSRLYWGASLKALENLAAKKGYAFVGCNGNGNNAYFICNQYAELPSVAGLKPRYQQASFAEYEVDGHRPRLDDALRVIRGLPVINTVSSESEPL
ncbi:MAG: hypothetical protein WDN48_15540 [Pseudolabrys sp.]